MSEKLPHQYKAVELGFEKKVHKDYNYNAKTMGKGHKSDFTDPRRFAWVPGPIYEAHEK